MPEAPIESSTPPEPAAAEPASGLRRLVAMGYELLPVAAICFLATLPILPMMPADHVPSGALWFQLWLLGVLYGYFAWGWVRGGQTLAMRAWRLRVERNDGSNIDWREASTRFLVGLMGWLLLGIGHWWMLFDPHRRNWCDLATGTRVVKVTDKGNAS